MKHDNSVNQERYNRLKQVVTGSVPSEVELEILKEKDALKVFTCNQFQGKFIGGTAAVIVAETKEEAATLLHKRLVRMGLLGAVTPENMVELDTSVKEVTILNDGS